MKKVYKLLAVVLSAALLYSCFGVFSVSADETDYKASDYTHLEGDIDGDGKVTEDDFNYALNVVLGKTEKPAPTSPEFMAMNFTKAGLTMEDARRVYRIYKGYDAPDEYYTTEELVELFNTLAGTVKNSLYKSTETMTYYSKNITATETKSFDFGAYTTLIKPLLDDAMTEDVEYTALNKGVRIYAVESDSGVRTNFPAFGQTTVSRLTASDVKSITMTRGAMDINEVANIPDTYRKNANATTDISVKYYKDLQAQFTDVIKLRVELKQQDWNTVKNSGSSAYDGYYNLFGTDIRELAGEYPMTEDQSADGMTMIMTMNLNNLTMAGSAVFYLDPVTLNPIAAYYESNIMTDSNVAMTMGFEDININGTMNPISNAKSQYVFWFNQFCPVEVVA